jgi:hypothetical protein
MANKVNDKTVEYIRYCYSNVENIRLSYHNQASMLMVIVAFMVFACVATIRSVYEKYVATWNVLSVITVFLWGILLLSLLITIFFTIRVAMQIKGSVANKDNIKALLAPIHMSDLSNK